MEKQIIIKIQKKCRGRGKERSEWEHLCNVELVNVHADDNDKYMDHEPTE
jgi:hypothetical protein